MTQEYSPAGQPIIQLRSVSKTFSRGGKLNRAVDSVSFSIAAGETIALVGESGSGKTTVSRIALGLVKPDEGDVLLQGEKLYEMNADALRTKRTAMQPVFQDSGAAFNPRRTIQQILFQAIEANPVRESDPHRKAVQLLDSVRLGPGEDFLRRFPHELSGGQRQRLAIARAVAVGPKLIVADEPLSGADVTIRGQVLNLLLDLQAQSQLAYLFVTHDIAIARAFAHRVIVMYKGQVVEQGTAEEVVGNPKHAYTQRLVSSALRFTEVG